MAFIEIKNVRIAGISAAVPKQVASNLSPADNKTFAKGTTPEDFIKATGVQERRISETLCTSDLCYAAADKLINELKWDRDEVGALIFLSHTPDYISPNTSCILQDRLGLSKECCAYDCSLGCSGWVYGLSQILSLVSLGSIKKALLLCGEGRTCVDTPLDPLFGHAGTATAVEYREGEKGFQFHLGTDGSGYDTIIIPDGGSRNRVSPKSFELEEFEGKMMTRLQSRMKGMDVFAFGISVPPKSIKKLAEHFQFDYLEADYVVLHQANMKLVNMIAKKLKLAPEKVPSNIANFGNTSSASIPLNIVTRIRQEVMAKPTRLICCAFGVGLSWGTVAFETSDIVISELVEVDEIA